jgi:hypothetical protein
MISHLVRGGWENKGWSAPRVGGRELEAIAWAGLDGHTRPWWQTLKASWQTAGTLVRLVDLMAPRVT